MVMSWTNDMEVEPDSLEKIRETIVGALVPMIDSMLPIPTKEQRELLWQEFNYIVDRIDCLWAIISEDTDGDDKPNE